MLRLVNTHLCWWLMPLPVPVHIMFILYIVLCFCKLHASCKIASSSTCCLLPVAACYFYLYSNLQTYNYRLTETHLSLSLTPPLTSRHQSRPQPLDVALSKCNILEASDWTLHVQNVKCIREALWQVGLPWFLPRTVPMICKLGLEDLPCSQSSTHQCTQCPLQKGPGHRQPVTVPAAFSSCPLV